MVRGEIAQAGVPKHILIFYSQKGRQFSWMIDVFNVCRGELKYRRAVMHATVLYARECRCWKNVGEFIYSRCKYPNFAIHTLVFRMVMPFQKRPCNIYSINIGDVYAYCEETILYTDTM